jgi:serine/threonine-protein kinase
MTGASQVLGTAQYLSPEQARGERVDARSDLYSTGCVLYELLTGRPPFSGDSPVAIAYQHVRENPVPPSQVDREIPPWVDAIVLKAMAKSPADRYQNATEMRADIQHAMSGLHGSPPTVEMPRQTQRLGGHQTVAAPPTTAIPGYQYGEGAEPPSGNRRRTLLWVLFGLVVLAAVIVVAYLALAGGGGKSYTVPDVRGLTQQQASKKIAAEHLQPQFISENSPSVPKGRVIGTSPAPGTVLPADSVVKVFVSASHQRVTVPNVVGDDVSTARTKLTNAGLNPVVKLDNISTAPPNTVVKQNPPEGTKLSPNSTVTIYAAGGGTKVQDVRGDPAATAKSILKGQGFRATEIKRPGPSSAQAGTVYEQNPAGGTALAPGSTVTIYVQPPTTRPVIAATPTTLSVAQGSTGTFSVTLSAAPTSDVTVTVSLTSGNTGLSVGSGGTLTFTSSNWNVAQNVTITADSSSTGSATFTASATGYTAATVTATETTSSGGNSHATGPTTPGIRPAHRAPRPYLANARSPRASIAKQRRSGAELE